MLLRLETFDFINNFLRKNSAEEFNNIYETYLQSRNILIEPMIDNINKNFTTGIGFGVASSLSTANIQLDRFFNLPIWMSVEKGTIYIAISEELGIFGFILFVLWIFIL